MFFFFFFINFNLLKFYIIIFFIVLFWYLLTLLSGKYTEFGQLIHGLNNVLSLSRSLTFPNETPVKPIFIKSITIYSNQLT